MVVLSPWRLTGGVLITGTLDAVAKMLKHEGLLSFYKVRSPVPVWATFPVAALLRVLSHPFLAI